MRQNPHPEGAGYLSRMTLETALTKLHQEGMALVVEKDGRTLFESPASGLRAWLACIAECGDELRGATAIDKIVGAAAAKLCLVAGVAQVFAETASASAVELLTEAGVFAQAQHVVPHILNRDGSDTCPMEKLSASIADAQEFYEAVKAKISNG